MFVVLLVIGILSTAVGGVGLICEAHYGDGLSILFMSLLGGGLSLVIIGATQTMKNYFFELAAPVKSYQANIGVLQKQYDELVVKLETLVEKYFSHESGLLEALKGRDSSNLAALLENYPELKAMGGTETLINQIVGLRGKICEAQKKYNSKAAYFNQYAQMTPYRHFVPAGMERTFEYINPSAE